MHWVCKILIIHLLLCHFVYGQSFDVSPILPDFTDITADWVTATYGPSEDPFLYKGLLEKRHRIITEQEKDVYTGRRLPVLPEGVDRVVCLGDAETGGAESLTYRFRVDPETALLRIRYAAVSSDYVGWRWYPTGKIPYFSVRVIPPSGKTATYCDEFSPQLQPKNILLPIEGMGPFWNDWNDCILDLTRYAGENVQLQFITSDGTEGGWEYLYFTVNAISSRMQMSGCEGKAFDLAAPEGFWRYSWHNGSENWKNRWQLGENDITLSCEVISSNACRFYMSAYVSGKGEFLPKDTVLYDTVNQGEEYKKNGFYLSVLLTPGDYTYHRSYCDLSHCAVSSVRTLFLTVRQRYYPLSAHICQGESYVENGFEFHKPAPGKYSDTLFYKSVSGADSLVCLQLFVSSSFSNPGGINGNPAPCTGESEVYTSEFSDTYGIFQWEVPEGVTILSGKQSTQLKLLFSEDAQPVTIIFQGMNGCGTGTSRLEITPRPSYRKYVADTICAGSEYHAYGFHLPSQEKSDEIKFYYQNNKTFTGCDSLSILALSVTQLPEIKILTSDSVICEEKEVRLRAVSEKIDETGEGSVSVGDIYCSDGKIVSLREYIASDKVAEGVVFWVQPDRKHGWIVHKDIQCESCAWVAGEGIPLPDDLVYWERGNREQDTAGYENTKLFVEMNRKSDYPILEKVKFEEGWYIPALGQLNVLCGIFVELNPVLIQIGGTELFHREVNTVYWSSTFRKLGKVDNYTLEQKWEEVEETYVYRNWISPLYDKNRLRTIRNF